MLKYYLLLCMCDASEKRFPTSKTSKNDSKLLKICLAQYLKAQIISTLDPTSKISTTNSKVFFSETMLKLDQKLMNSIRNNKSHEFRPIMLEVLQLQTRFIESNSFTEFTKFKDLRRSLSNTIRVNKEIHSNSVKFEKLKEEVLKKIDERNKKKIDRKAKRLNRDIINEGKETIQLLEAKIQEEQQISKQFEEKNIEMTKKFKEQTEELKAQKDTITRMIAEKKEKENENEKYQKEERELSNRFCMFYEKIIGKKIFDIPDFYFEMDLNDKKQRTLLKQLAGAEFKLPNIKAVQIGSISDSNTDVNNFLNDCVPTQLKLFRFNCTSVSDARVKAKFYMESLSKIVSVTTKEVYLKCLEFNDAELEKIVKASCNTKRLIFEECDFNCPTYLNLRSRLKYNIKTLIFQSCRSTDPSDSKSSLKFGPDYFDKIIRAILNSGLSDSLQKISIYGSQTQSVEKVQQILKENRMSQVTVNEEYFKVKTS